MTLKVYLIAVAANVSHGQAKGPVRIVSRYIDPRPSSMSEPSTIQHPINCLLLLFTHLHPLHLSNQPNRQHGSSILERRSGDQVRRKLAILRLSRGHRPCGCRQPRPRNSCSCQMYQQYSYDYRHCRRGDRRSSRRNGRRRIDGRCWYRLPAWHFEPHQRRQCKDCVPISPANHH
jgi:hypothetical protein